jgi:hypothetical protein
MNKLCWIDKYIAIGTEPDGNYVIFNYDNGELRILGENWKKPKRAGAKMPHKIFKHIVENIWILISI